MRREGCSKRYLAIMLAAGLLAAVGCQSPPPSPAATSPSLAPTAAPAQPTVAAKPTAAAAAPMAAAAQPTTASAAQPATQLEVLKIGIMASTTGPGVRIGQNVDRFIRLSIDDVNAKGGFKVGDKTYKFEAVTADDKGNSDGGREAANRLVLSEKVRFVLGPTSSPVAGAQAITEPAKVAIIGLTAVDKGLGPAFPLTLQVGQSHNIMRSAAIYEWLAKEMPQVKRVIAVMPDDATGRTIADLAEGNIKEKGGSMVAKEYYPSDLKDFSPLIARVLRQNPDAIDIGPGGARGPLFLALMKALTDQGFNGQVVGTSAEAGALREGASFIKAFAMSFPVDWRSSAFSNTEKQVSQRIFDKYGEADFEIAPLPMYAGAPMLAQAMEKAGSVDDVEKIIKTMREGEWDTLFTAKWGKTRFVGAKTFGLPSIMEQPVYLTRVGGGKVETFTAIKGVLP